MGKLIVVDHPLIAHSLTVLRDKKTDVEEFRRHAEIVSKILMVEATRNLASVPVKIETPLAPMVGSRLKKEIVVVPVLRSGIGILFALQKLLPAAAVGFIGLSRDEKTAVAHEYYENLPKIYGKHTVFLIDPMLATGGSCSESIKLLKAKGAEHIILVCLVSAPEGIAVVQEQFPDVDIYTAAVDEHLNERKFIVPGLGDFGDRYFGTV